MIMTNEKSIATTPAAPKKLDILKSILNAESVQEQFKNALNKNSTAFIASVIDLYNNDKNLQACEPKQVVMEALKAAVLKLPINKALGYAYIIPFNNNVKQLDGSWKKVMTPTFQMGYKGYIQLAMRTGQYRTINADIVYDGELKKVSKLTGEINFDGVKASENVVGYFCYFELLNGFSKTLYMTIDEMALHAKRFSKGVKKETTIQTLKGLANVEVNTDSKSVGWMGNFHSMALKTVIRLLLSKYGYLSIEMQEAFANDIDGESGTNDSDTVAVQTFEVSDAEYTEIDGDTADSDKSTDDSNPGY